MDFRFIRKNMNKNIIIIIVIIILIIGAVILFTGSKTCSELNEQECKMDDSCLSVLVPCTNIDCTSDTIFKECKDK